MRARWRRYQTSWLLLAGHLGASVRAPFETIADPLRAAPQNIAALDGDEVLAKLAMLPVTTWSFIEAPGVRHAGPMAQDFRAAFGLGENDTSISYTDINGINMRAIQALIEEIAKLRERVAELEATRFRRPRQ